MLDGFTSWFLELCLVWPVGLIVSVVCLLVDRSIGKRLKEDPNNGDLMRESIMMLRVAALSGCVALTLALIRARITGNW